MEALVKHAAWDLARWRQIHADKWREARRRWRALPPGPRAAVLRYWNKSNMPADSVYFATVVHEAEKGVNYWAKLANIRRLELVREGRLPRELVMVKIVSNKNVRPSKQPALRPVSP